MGMADQESSSRFDKFTAQARNVFILAQREAVRFQHNYIGTEHLLLGLVQEEESGAAKVLANMGVDLKKVRSATAYIVCVGDRIVPGEIGLTPRAKKVIEFAINEARRLNHHSIGTEHLLLGLVYESNSTAARVMESLGVNQEALKTEILASFNLAVMPEHQASQEQSSGITVLPRFKTEIRKVQQLETLSQGDPRVVPALIQAYKQIIERLQVHREPIFYAAMCNRMGIAYRRLPIEDHEANLRMAIKCFNEALRFYTPKTAPLNYAEAQNNLGNAYGDLLTEDRSVNQKRAIHCYEEALRFWTPEACAGYLGHLFLKSGRCTETISRLPHHLHQGVHRQAM